MYLISKLCIFAIVLTSSISSFGQISKKLSAPTNLKDTVYIGIDNQVKLEANRSNPISAKSVGAEISINGNQLIVRPSIQGELYITITYKDTTITRKFISTYLPDPSK
jgi:hypothetical protein